MSIHRTKNGTWIVRYRTEHVLKSKTFKRKDDAKAFEQQMASNKVQRIKDPDRGERLLFETWAERWLTTHSKCNKAYQSYLTDRSMIARVFSPIWATRDLSSIRGKEVEDLQHRLLESGLAPKTVNNILGLCHKVFGDAVKKGFIDKNPCNVITPLRVPKQEFHSWSFSEVKKFLSWAKANSPRYYFLVLFFVSSGMRKGELQALRIGDLDFLNKKIHINKQYVYRMKTDGPPKYNSYRTLPMNAALESAVRPLKRLPKDRHVVDIKLYRFALEQLKVAAREAGVPEMTFHGLRHTCCSLLAMSGVDVYKLKEFMGHSDIRMTMRYMHLSPGHLQGVSDALNDLI